MAERWEIISRMAHDDGSIKGGANENPLAVLLIDRRECIVVVKTENEIIKRKKKSLEYSQKQDL